MTDLERWRKVFTYLTSVVTQLEFAISSGFVQLDRKTPFEKLTEAIKVAEKYVYDPRLEEKSIAILVAMDKLTGEK